MQMSGESYDCVTVKHAIHVEIIGFEVCARLRRQSAATSLLLFEFTKTVDADSFCECSKGSSETPAEFDPSVSDERIQRAIEWILELDAQTVDDCRRGRLVSKRIPLKPRPLPVRPASTAMEEVQAARPQLGVLLRPLFLRPPSAEALFPFQEIGTEWLVERKAGILGDDMGLGKTVQAIQALRQLVGSGEMRTALVLCPKTLVVNWDSELRRWAPELTTIALSPSSAEKEAVWEAAINRFHVVITNYEQLREPPSALTVKALDLLIADEAHRIRNLGALTTKGVKKLRAKRFWALTGTPIERDATDLATLLSIMFPARFSVSDSGLHESTLRARARPYVLRRLKKDVLTELPEVLESTEILELLPSQRRAYRIAVRDARRRNSHDETLSLITTLRTICDYDPKSGHSVKIQRLIEIMENLQKTDEKLVAFSNTLRPLELARDGLAAILGPRGSVRLIGEMNAAERATAIAAFKTDSSVRVLLASTGVAGEGLTLTEANHVVFLNESWNPSANAQARDRVVRIGQKRGVRVYHFRCQDTIEGLLEEILQEKGETFSNLIDRMAKGPGGGASPILLAEVRERLLDAPS